MPHKHADNTGFNTDSAYQPVDAFQQRVDANTRAYAHPSKTPYTSTHTLPSTADFNVDFTDTNAMVTDPT